MNPLQPTPALLCKLGSIAVHADEMRGIGAHEFDKHAMDTLLDDADVKAWLAEMDGMAMLPKKRTAGDIRLYAQREGHNQLRRKH
jgi:hypothetical protein